MDLMIYQVLISRKINRNYTNENSVVLTLEQDLVIFGLRKKIKLKSLIMAQIERWRQA